MHCMCVNSHKATRGNVFWRPLGTGLQLFWAPAYSLDPFWPRLLWSDSTLSKNKFTTNPKRTTSGLPVSFKLRDRLLDTECRIILNTWTRSDNLAVVRQHIQESYWVLSITTSVVWNKPLTMAQNTTRHIGGMSNKNARCRAMRCTVTWLLWQLKLSPGDTKPAFNTVHSSACMWSCMTFKVDDFTYSQTLWTSKKETENVRCISLQWRTTHVIEKTQILHH